MDKTIEQLAEDAELAVACAKGAFHKAREAVTALEEAIAKTSSRRVVLEADLRYMNETYEEGDL